MAFSESSLRALTTRRCRGNAGLHRGVPGSARLCWSQARTAGTLGSAKAASVSAGVPTGSTARRDDSRPRSRARRSGRRRRTPGGGPGKVARHEGLDRRALVAPRRRSSTHHLAELDDRFAAELGRAGIDEFAHCDRFVGRAAIMQRHADLLVLDLDPRMGSRKRRYLGHQRGDPGRRRDAIQAAVRQSSFEPVQAGVGSASGASRRSRSATGRPLTSATARLNRSVRLRSNGTRLAGTVTWSGVDAISTKVPSKSRNTAASAGKAGMPSTIVISVIGIPCRWTQRVNAGCVAVRYFTIPGRYSSNQRF